MLVVIDMATRKTDIIDADPAAYGEEVLCANWTPVPQPALEPVRAEGSGAGVSHPAVADAVDGFLERMYACQQA